VPHYQREILLQFIDVNLQVGDYVIELLDCVLVMHQLNFNVGYPLVHCVPSLFQPPFNFPGMFSRLITEDTQTVIILMTG
jgi:hypothetical protein